MNEEIESLKSENDALRRAIARTERDFEEAEALLDQAHRETADVRRQLARMEAMLLFAKG